MRESEILNNSNGRVKTFVRGEIPDTAITSHVDVVFIHQAVNLLRSQAAVAEHANLFQGAKIIMGEKMAIRMNRNCRNKLIRRRE